MGEYADMMNEGFCCQTCGELIDGDEPGFARFCAGCAPAPAQPQRRSRVPDQGENVKKVNRAPGPRQHKPWRCLDCPRSFGGEYAARMHWRDSHGRKPAIAEAC